MFAPDAGTAAGSWRPQQFGDRRAAEIDDPIIEPLWTGPRVLALVDRGTVRVTDIEGLAIDGHHEIRDGLIEAAAGTTILLEAYLTAEPIQDPGDLAAREDVPIPQPGKALTQMAFGQRSAKAVRLETRTEEARRRSAADSLPEHAVALVAVDLLWLDDEALLDVPLLERKRILESVLPESHLIRRGVHVRPPVDTWLGSWRAFGFNRIAYKAANSRYVPGEKNPHWALAEIPRR